MGSGHSHRHDIEVPAPVRRIALLALAPFLAAVLVGLVVLWPQPSGASLIVGDFVRGTVVDAQPCPGGVPDCTTLTVTIDEGPDRGSTIAVTVNDGPATPDLSAGTAVLLQPVPDAPAGSAYALADVDRTGPLLLLTALFSVAVVALARWKGVLALAGLVSTGLVLGFFLLPALLEGSAQVLVAAVGAGAIAAISMGLAHGFTVRTAIALLGTLAALLLTTVLGAVFTDLVNLTGLGTEDAAFLSAVGGDLDLQGLLLAGLVIGALGVLDDVTVTQVAAVWEVYGADRTLSFRQLWAAGMRVGRDHVAAVVNTLVLAYVGASLPLVLLITLSDAPLLQSLNNEAVAAEIVRSLVGGLGIVAAVPITTSLAAWLLVRARAAGGAAGGAAGDPAAGPAG
jgi:uncharacterized membrane protein